MNTKILLLTSAALATAAFGLPTTAGATAVEATITDKGGAIENDQSAVFSGNAKFETLGSGKECAMHVTVTVNKDVVEITKVEITTSTCVFFGNPFGNCKFEGSEPIQITNLPWTLDPLTDEGKETLTVTGAATAGKPGVIDTKLEAKKPEVPCFTTKSNIMIEHDPKNNIAATLDVVTKSGFITGVQLTGTAKVEFSSGIIIPVGASGLLNIEAAKVGTYTFS